MRKNQRGIAFLVAIIIAVIMSLLGLSLTFLSMKEIASGNEFENHEKALLVADAGLNMIKGTLRGRDLSGVLAHQADVPRYVAGGDDGMGALRMPIFAIEARNIDFEANPGAMGSRTVNGLLTHPYGQLVTAAGYAGRFFAKLTDNADEGVFSLPDDPLTDRDGVVFLRVVGVFRGMVGEVSTYGGSRKNSVAVVEAMLKRDMTFDLQSPLSLYGNNVNSSWSGNSFKVDGYDHRGMTYDDILAGHSDNGLDPFNGVNCLYDAPASGDASGAVDAVKGDLDPKQYDNVEGAGGKPSVVDGTNDVRTGPNEDAQNIFDANFIAHFAESVAAVADYRYPDGTVLSGDSVRLGSAAEPKITVAEGDLTLNGNGEGSGILIVRGTLDIGGAFVYDGVILVVGDGQLRMHGANKSFLGGIFVANLVENGRDSYTYGQPTVNLQGHSQFFMKSDSIAMGYSMLPMRLLSWREITPEIEPGS